MSPNIVYPEIKRLLDKQLAPTVRAWTRERLALLVTGIIGAQHAGPAQMAVALQRLGVSAAQPESVERRIRRIENDPSVTAALCVHPFAQHYLRWGKPTQLVLLLDSTTQDDRVVLLSVSVWYRGRALPLAWAVWAANTPLTGPRFWQRVAALLAVVAPLLPVQVPVIWVADRAFGTPTFTDLLAARGWHYVVRVQGQTRCRDHQGREQRIGQLVCRVRQRAKLRGWAFKKAGWRPLSVVVFWGRRHRTPLCLVSDLAPAWPLLLLYRRRAPTEALFRHYKSYGWHWEQGQVTDLAHLERLLVGMALATWLVVMLGAQLAQQYLHRPPTGARHTRPWIGKFSLFTLGLHQARGWFQGHVRPRHPWALPDWNAPDWQIQIRNHHAFAFVFHLP
jgi:hypothetical protein